VGTPQP